MAGRVPSLTGRLPFALATLAMLAWAVFTDAVTTEHPSHIAVLGLVAIVIGALRVKLARGFDGVFPAVAGALVMQPALHAVSKAASLGGGSEHGTVLQMVAADGFAPAMQVAAPVLIVIAVASSIRFFELLLSALRHPIRLLITALDAPCVIPSNARTVRCGSMLRWCGWIIRAARRDPPQQLRLTVSDRVSPLLISAKNTEGAASGLSGQLSPTTARTAALPRGRELHDPLRLGSDFFCPSPFTST